MQFDPLLVALAAGVLIRNRTPSRDAVYEAIEGSSLPIYVLFFSVAGTTLLLEALAAVGVPALLFAAIRAAGLLAGTRLGARSRAPVPRSGAMRRSAVTARSPASGSDLAVR